MAIAPISVLRATAPVSDVAYFDEQTLMSGTSTGTVTLWDNEIKRSRRMIIGEDAVLSVQRREESMSEVLIQRRSGRVELWDAKLGKTATNVINTDAISFGKICQVCPNSFLSPTCEGNNIGIFSTDEGKRQAVFGSTEDAGIVLALGLYNSYPISIHERNGFVIWDSRNPSKPIDTWMPVGNESDALLKDGAVLQAMAIAGKYIWVASSEGHLWMLKPGPLKARKLPQLPAGTSSMCARNDRKLVAIAGWDNKVHLRDIKGNVLGSLTGHEGSISSVAFNHVHGYHGEFATGSSDGKIFLWDVYGDTVS